jgi:glycosyltransferase involved in cell wall biosynthesis
MKIGFDISQTGRYKAGCGYFADSLIQALTRLDQGNSYILYPHFGTTFWDPNAEGGTRKIDLPHVSRKRVSRDFAGAMAFWSQLPPDALQRLGNPNIIHCNNYYCPKGLDGAKIVYTLYDLSFLEYPELTMEENRFKCFGGVFDAAMYADFVVSISQFSRTKFLETFPHYPAERTRVVHLGSRFSIKEPAKARSGKLKGLSPGEFWLGVGTLEPRKNLRRLLKAFSLFKRRSTLPYPLALAGGSGWLEEDLEEFIRELHLNGQVRLLGYVSDPELAWLYQACYAFVYPSLYEGFGLPVLEAMASGAAVITSRNTSLREVGGDAAHYVDPLNVQDLAEGLMALSLGGAYRDDLKRRSLTQAGKFSWDKSAQAVLDVYAQVIQMKKLGGDVQITH